MALQALYPELHPLALSSKVVVLTDDGGTIEVALVQMTSLLGDNLLEFGAPRSFHFNMLLGDFCLALPVRNLSSQSGFVLL